MEKRKAPEMRLLSKSTSGGKAPEMRMLSKSMSGGKTPGIQVLRHWFASACFGAAGIILLTSLLLLYRDQGPGHTGFPLEELGRAGQMEAIWAIRDGLQRPGSVWDSYQGSSRIQRPGSEEGEHLGSSRIRGANSEGASGRNRIQGPSTEGHADLVSSVGVTSRGISTALPAIISKQEPGSRARAGPGSASHQKAKGRARAGPGSASHQKAKGRARAGPGSASHQKAKGRARAGPEEALRRHTAVSERLRRAAPATERAFRPARSLQGLLRRYAMYENRWAGRWRGGRPGVHPMGMLGVHPRGRPGAHQALGRPGAQQEGGRPGVHRAEGKPGVRPQGGVEGGDSLGGWFEWSSGSETELAQRVFGGGRRYYWAVGSGDKCAGEFHFTDSLKCVAAEARHLNRTLVLDPEVCLHPDHNGGRWLVNPLAAYYDLPSFLGGQPVIPVHVFLRALRALTTTSHAPGTPPGRALRALTAPHNPRAGVPPVRASSYSWATPTRPRLERDPSALVVRDLGLTGLASSRICIHQEPGVFPWKERRLEYNSNIMGVVDAIAEAMGGDFDVVHVRRGDKLRYRRQYPHLDRDTQAPALLKKLPQLIKPGRHIYIATNEKAPHFFDPLRALYKVHLMEDFSYLWSNTSRWYNASRALLKDEAYFDGRMQVAVDYTLRKRGRRTIETFNDLTSDPYYGV